MEIIMDSGKFKMLQTSHSIDISLFGIPLIGVDITYPAINEKPHYSIRRHKKISLDKSP